jgi:glycosyltransferase involved in cell wall biosynthesis
MKINNAELQKVIFFTTSLQSGGIENYLLRFLKLYHTKFSKIIVYSKSGQGGVLEEQYAAIPNVSIIKNLINYRVPKSFLHLNRWLKGYQDYVVCDFTGNFAGVVLWNARKANIQNRIALYRASTDHFQKDIFRTLYNNWVKNLVYKNATTILSNSKAAFNYYFPDVWENDSRFKVIYNGINAKVFTKEKGNLRKEFGIPIDAFVVGHTGRFDFSKNHSTIITVTEELLKKNRNIYFILCGHGVNQNLGEIFEKKGLSDRVLTYDYRSDIPKFLNTMDCYFFPSVTEGQPNSLIEAMISGIPIVASNIDPIKETTPQEVHPYLKAPLDIDGFIEQIESIYNSKDLGIKKFIFADWAKTHFNSEERFDEFFRELVSS